MGALSPSSPKQSPAFRASPTTPHPPQCPESMGEWTQGEEGKYVGSMTSPLWVVWGDGHLTGLTVEGKAWTAGVGVVCGGSWNAGL